MTGTILEEAIIITGPLHHASRVRRVLQTARVPLTKKEIASRLINFYPKLWDQKLHKKGGCYFLALEQLKSEVGNAIRTKKAGSDIMTIGEHKPVKHYIPD